MKLSFKKSLLLTSLLLSFLAAYTQKPITVSECTVTYGISGTDAATNKNLTNATKTLFIKGKLSRADLTGQGFNQSIIFNSQTGEAVILKEIGNEKYIKSYNKEQWITENNKYSGLKLSVTNETKTILGYECIKVIATLKNGASYGMYCAKTITPSTSESSFQFKDAPGLVLEYETSSGTSDVSKIIYTATTINFNPVPASRFEIPKTGYRTLQ